MKFIDKSFRSTSNLELSRLFLPGNLAAERLSARDFGTGSQKSALNRSSSLSSPAAVPLSAASLEAFERILEDFCAVRSLQSAVSMRPDFTVATLTANRAWPATKHAVEQLARLVSEERLGDEKACHAMARVFESADGASLDLRRLFCPKSSPQCRFNRLLSSKRDLLTKDHVGVEYLSKKTKQLVAQFLAGLFAHFRTIEKGLAIVCREEGLLAFGLGLAKKKCLEVSAESIFSALSASRGKPRVDRELVTSWLSCMFETDESGALDYRDFADSLGAFTEARAADIN